MDIVDSPKLGNHVTKRHWTVRDEEKWQKAVECAHLLVSEFWKFYHLPECFFNPYGTKVLPQPVQELPSRIELFNIFRTPGSVSDRKAHKEYGKIMVKLQNEQKKQVKAGFIYVVPRETFRTKWVMQSKEMKVKESKVMGVLMTKAGGKGQNRKNTMEPPERQLTTEEAMALYTVKVEVFDSEYDTVAQTPAANATPSHPSSVAPTPAPPANLPQHHTPHLTVGFSPSPTPSMLQDLALRTTASASASSLPSTLSGLTSSEIRESGSESAVSGNALMSAQTVYPSNDYSLFGVTPNTASSQLSASFSADGFAPLPASNDNLNLCPSNGSRGTQNSSVPYQSALLLHQPDAQSSIDKTAPLPKSTVPLPDFSLLDLSIPAQPHHLQTLPAAPQPISSHLTGTHSNDSFAVFPIASDAQKKHANLSNNEAAVLLEALFAKCIPSQPSGASSHMQHSGQMDHGRISPPGQRRLIQLDTSLISTVLAQPDISSILPTSSGGLPPFQTFDEFLKSQPKGSTLDSGTPTPPQPILPPPTAGSSQAYSSGHGDKLRSGVMTPQHHQSISPANCSLSAISLTQPKRIADTTGRPPSDHISLTGKCRQPNDNRASTPQAPTLERMPESGRDSTPPPPLEDIEKQNFVTQSLLFIPPFRAMSPQLGPPALGPHLRRQYQPIALGNHFTPFNGKQVPQPVTWANQPYPWAEKFPDMPMYPHPCHAPDVPPPQMKKAPTAHRAPPKPKKNERVTQYEHRSLKVNHEMLTMYHRELIGEHSDLQKKYESAEKERDCAQELVTQTQKELLASNTQNKQYESRIDFLFQMMNSCVSQVDKVTQEISKERSLRGEQQKRISDLEGEMRSMRSSIDDFNEAKTDFIEVLKANKLECDTFVEHTKKKSESEFSGALKEALETLKHFNHQENEASKKKIVEQKECLKAVEEKWSREFTAAQERLTQLENFKVQTELTRELRAKCQSWLKHQRENGSFPSEEQSDSSPSYSATQSEEPADFAEVDEARRRRKRERKERKMDSPKKEKRRKVS